MSDSEANAMGETRDEQRYGKSAGRAHTPGPMGAYRPPATSPRTTPADGVTRPQRRWMTAQWGARRELYLRRLGEWMWTTRSRLGLSLRDLTRLAHEQGESLSISQLSRMELMREPARAAERQFVSLTAVAYLASLAGQTLADVDAYLRAGDTAALDPALASRAETVRTAFLTLSEARRQALEDFAQYLFELDLAEQAPQRNPGNLAGIPTITAAPRDGDTRRALDELNATVDGALEEIEEIEENHEGHEEGLAGETSGDASRAKRRGRR